MRNDYSETVLRFRCLPLNIFKALCSQNLLKECIKIGRVADGVNLGYHGFRNALKPMLQQLQECYPLRAGFPLFDTLFDALLKCDFCHRFKHGFYLHSARMRVYNLYQCLAFLRRTSMIYQRKLLTRGRSQVPSTTNEHFCPESAPTEMEKNGRGLWSKSSYVLLYAKLLFFSTYSLSF